MIYSTKKLVMIVIMLIGCIVFILNSSYIHYLNSQGMLIPPSDYILFEDNHTIVLSDEQYAQMFPHTKQNKDANKSLTKNADVQLSLVNDSSITTTGGSKSRNSQVGSLHDFHRITRPERFNTWFREGTDQLKPDADMDEPILDFAIVGFAKCGTTTMEANLKEIAPMPVSDICTPVHNTVWYAYNLWPQQYGEKLTYRGTKCPRVLDEYATTLQDYSTFLPKTKLIVGIRHPVLWFQSFWNQLHAGEDKNPYDQTTLCLGSQCSNGCKKKELVCIHRSRFHVILSRMGKTDLTDDERAILAPNDADGGIHIPNLQIRNHIFLYELREINEQYVWDELEKYLDYPQKIDYGNNYMKSDGRGKTYTKLNICDAEYDDLRKLIMPYAYELSIWLREYFIPQASVREDVVIPNVSRFLDLVKDYADDPCGRLVRQEESGEYILNV